MVTQTEKEQAIAAIANANNGVVTPNAVIDAAKNPKHILHECFIWDDEIAAHQHRLNTARHLIASVEVLVEYEERTVSAISYVHDPRCGRRGQGYIAITSLVKRREEAIEAVQIELERIMGSISRARSIATGLGLEQYFETILENALQAKIKLKTKQKKAA